MFGIGLPEMIVILAVALIVVGPDKLPELARSLAKGVNELKETMNQVKDSLNEETKIVSSVQKDIQQTAGQMKTRLLEDVTKNPGQWKREGETGTVSDDAKGNEQLIEAEVLSHSREKETEPALKKNVSASADKTAEPPSDNNTVSDRHDDENSPRSPGSAV
ncbi:MAG: twin-arginine translocase subunit TatB [Candidatus Electrothrix sp. EH2]|nr:twin-arginine translocase subunit TatB [Candidatus Electrothrix sp. EH2]